jgi:hypothetical protein
MAAADTSTILITSLIPCIPLRFGKKGKFFFDYDSNSVQTPLAVMRKKAGVGWASHKKGERLVG